MNGLTASSKSILDTKTSESQCHQLVLKQAEFEDHVHGQQWVWKTNDKCDLDRTVHFVVEESRAPLASGERLGS